MLYDETKDRYIVARDHCGIIPLYWGRDKVFALLQNHLLSHVLLHVLSRLLFHVLFVLLSHVLSHLLSRLLSRFWLATCLVSLVCSRVSTSPLPPLTKQKSKDGNRWIASELKALHDVCEELGDFPPGHVYDSATDTLTKWWDFLTTPHLHSPSTAFLFSICNVPHNLVTELHRPPT